MDSLFTGEFFDRQKETLVELRAVHAKSINFGRIVGGDYVAVRGRVTRGLDRDPNHAVYERPPFTLHSEESGRYLQDQIASAAVADRSVYAQAIASCFFCECEFGEIAF